MLFGLSLLIMVIVALISLVLGANLTTSMESNLTDWDTIINGSTTTYELINSELQFISPDPLVGGLATLTVLITIGAILGIRVLGSGLADETVRVLIFALTYIGIWTMLSVLSYSLIRQIKVFGYFIYILLTIMYVVGCLQRYFDKD